MFSCSLAGAADEVDEDDDDVDVDEAVVVVSPIAVDDD